MISRRKLSKLSEELFDFYSEELKPVRKDPAVTAYFVGIIEGFRIVNNKRVNRISILEDLVKLKTQNLALKITSQIKEVCNDSCAGGSDSDCDPESNQDKA